MMLTCEKTERLISAYLDGEVTASQWREAEAHIQNCQRCAATLRSFQQTTTMYQSELAKHEPSAEVWSLVAGRLESLRPSSKAQQIRNWFKVTLERFVVHPPVFVRFAQVGLAVAALTVFVVARFQQQPPLDLTDPTSQPIVQGDSSFSPPVVFYYNPSEEKQRLVEASVAQQVQSYLDRAGVLLMEVKNSDSTFEQEEIADIRKASNDLLEQTILIKQNLKKSQLSVLMNTIDQLEIILLDAANLQEAPDVDEIESLKATILQNNLLIKIEIYDASELQRAMKESQPGSALRSARRLQKI